jgi:hypothetical protein
MSTGKNAVLNELEEALAHGSAERRSGGRRCLDSLMFNTRNQLQPPDASRLRGHHQEGRRSEGCLA